MKHIIVGYDSYSKELIKTLLKVNNCKVVIITDDRSKIDMSVHSSVFIKETQLKNLNIVNFINNIAADTIIANTESEITNVFLCQQAKMHNSAIKTICRLHREKKDSATISSIDYAFSPENIAAKMLINSLSHSYTSHVKGFGSNFLIFSFKTPRAIFNLQSYIQSINGKVLAIERNNETFLDKDIISVKEGDKVYIFIPMSKLQLLHEYLGLKKLQYRLNNIYFCGASRLTHSLIGHINAFKKNLKYTVIDYNKEAMIKLKQAHEGIDISLFEGDFLSQKMRTKSYISNNDMILSTSNDDNANIISATMCSQNEAINNFTFLTKNEHMKILRPLNGSINIDPMQCTIEQIISYIFNDKIDDISAIINKKYSILALSVTNKNIKQLQSGKGVYSDINFILVAHQSKNSANEMSVHTNNAQLNVGDKIIILIKNKQLDLILSKSSAS